MDKTKKITSITDAFFQGPKSVLSSTAQNTILCVQGSSSEEILNSYIAKVMACPGLSSIDKGIMLLCICEGLRISEVLSVTSNDWLSNSKVLIRGKKKSFDRVVSVLYFGEVMRVFTKNMHSLASAGNRFYFYREMKKIGIVFKSGNSSKMSVTHAGRHLLADGIYQMGKDIELSQRTLGHKSVNSTMYYVEKK